MKVNVIKVKDKYAQSCGSLDWYDHISGMSARDVEIEMEYVCEQVTTEMLQMLRYFTDFPDSDFEDFNLSDMFEMTVMVHKIAETKQLIKEATEL